MTFCMTSTVFYAFVTAIDLGAVTAITVALWLHQCGHYSVWMRVAYVTLILGLLAQAFHNITFLVTGVGPVGINSYLWFLKDVGVFIAFIRLLLVAKHEDNK